MESAGPAHSYPLSSQSGTRFVATLQDAYGRAMPTSNACYTPARNSAASLSIDYHPSGTYLPWLFSGCATDCGLQTIAQLARAWTAAVSNSGYQEMTKQQFLDALRAAGAPEVEFKLRTDKGLYQHWTLKHQTDNVHSAVLLGRLAELSHAPLPDDQPTATGDTRNRAIVSRGDETATQQLIRNITTTNSASARQEVATLPVCLAGGLQGRILITEVPLVSLVRTSQTRPRSRFEMQSRGNVGSAATSRTGVVVRQTSDHSSGDHQQADASAAGNTLWAPAGLIDYGDLSDVDAPADRF